MHTQQIKTRADGSIDTAFYIARGRRARSQATHSGLKSLRQALARLVRPLIGGAAPKPSAVGPRRPAPVAHAPKTAA